jgi:hypothetical protein
MATFPPGILSFLYNVMNDDEINEKFRQSEESREDVMEFFMLKDPLRKIFRDASERFYKKKKSLGSVYLSYDQAKQLAEAEFDEYTEDVQTLFKALKEELKECYGRFW